MKDQNGIIQIWKLRNENNKNDKSQRKLFDTKRTSISINDLFKNYQDMVNGFDPSERYNLFYTVQNCNKNEKERTFISTDIIPIDIDNVDPNNIIETSTHVLNSLKDFGLVPAKVATISSGNGLHFLIQTKTLFTNDNFDAYKKSYLGLITYLTKQLKEGQYFGRIDNIWKKGQLLRLPGTLNKKKDKETRKCEFLNSKLEAQDFNLRQFEKYAPEVPPDTLPEKLHKHLTYGTIESIESNCNFIKHTIENAATLPEPEWYASLGVYAFLENGRERAHEISSPHPNYSEKETDTKLTQILKNTKGPRTCHSISELTYNEHCNNCEYKDKISTPCQITGKKIYPHENIGFCTISPQGKLTPYYIEMVDKVHEDNELIYIPESRNFYSYKENHYKIILEETLRSQINKLSQRKYLSPNTSETIQLLKDFEPIQKSINWLKDTTKNKLNLKNGILDLESMSILPHTRDIGFVSCIDYTFDPMAKCPTFEKFMLDISQNDLEWIAVMQEWMGYILVPSEPLASKALWLYGPTSSNGKNTFTKMIASLLPKEETTGIRVEMMSDPFYLVKLLNSRLNIADEANKVRPRNTDKVDLASTLNMLVTGELMEIRGAHAKRVSSLENWARMVFISNEIPNLDSVKGFDRRVMYVPFNAKFTEENKDIYILDKLKKERSGILNFAIEGYLRLKKNNFKFSDCKRISDLTSEKIKNKDVYFEWIHQNFERSNDNYCLKESIRNKHKKDMEEINEPRLSDKVLFSKIKQAFDLDDKDLEQKSKGVDRKPVVKNIRQKSEYEDG